MNLNKFLTYLNEELKDIPASSENIHYTTLDHLFNILSDGKIIGSNYSVKTFKNKHNPELCTVRSSRSKELDSIDRYDLSEGASGSVKFFLFTKRILSSVRGVKKAPIAELPIVSKTNRETIKKEFKKKYGVDCPVIDPRNSCKLSVFYQKRDEKQEEVYNKILDSLKKLGLDKDESAIHLAVYLNNANCDHLADLKNRESEERFLFNNSNGIPIKPELMKIKILNGWESDLDDNIGEEGVYNKDTWKKFYDLLNKYESCFVNDYEFKSLKAEIKKYAEQDED